MAAHLDLIQLRQHALPGYLVALADRLGEASNLSVGRPGPGAGRARLIATWQVDANRHLVCSWSLDTEDPHLLPI